MQFTLLKNGFILILSHKILTFWIRNPNIICIACKKTILLMSTVDDVFIKCHLNSKSYSFHVLKLHRLMSVKRNLNKYWFFIFVFIFCYISFTSLSLTSLRNKLNHKNTHTQPSHHEIKPIQNPLAKPQTPTHSTTHADPALQLLWLLVVPKISSQNSITVHVDQVIIINISLMTQLHKLYSNHQYVRERERERFQCWHWDPRWIYSVAMDWS